MNNICLSMDLSLTDTIKEDKLIKFLKRKRGTVKKNNLFDYNLQSPRISPFKIENVPAKRTIQGISKNVGNSSKIPKKNAIATNMYDLESIRNSAKTKFDGITNQVPKKRLSLKRKVSSNDLGRRVLLQEFEKTIPTKHFEPLAASTPTKLNETNLEDNMPVISLIIGAKVMPAIEQIKSNENLQNHQNFENNKSSHKEGNYKDLSLQENLEIKSISKIKNVLKKSISKSDFVEKNSKQATLLEYNNKKITNVLNNHSELIENNEKNHISTNLSSVLIVTNQIEKIKNTKATSDSKVNENSDQTKANEDVRQIEEHESLPVENSKPEILQNLETVQESIDLVINQDDKNNPTNELNKENESTNDDGNSLRTRNMSSESNFELQVSDSDSNFDENLLEPVKDVFDDKTKNQFVRDCTPKIGIQLMNKMLKNKKSLNSSQQSRKTIYRKMDPLTKSYLNVMKIVKSKKKNSNGKIRRKLYTKGKSDNDESVLGVFSNNQTKMNSILSENITEKLKKTRKNGKFNRKTIINNQQQNVTISEVLNVWQNENITETVENLTSNNQVFQESPTKNTATTLSKSVSRNSKLRKINSEEINVRRSKRTHRLPRAYWSSRISKNINDSEIKILTDSYKDCLKSKKNKRSKSVAKEIMDSSENINISNDQVFKIPAVPSQPLRKRFKKKHTTEAISNDYLCQNIEKRPKNKPIKKKENASRKKSTFKKKKESFSELSIPISNDLNASSSSVSILSRKEKLSEINTIQNSEEIIIRRSTRTHRLPRPYWSSRLRNLEVTNDSPTKILGNKYIVVLKQNKKKQRSKIIANEITESSENKNISNENVDEIATVEMI